MHDQTPDLQSPSPTARGESGTYARDACGAPALAGLPAPDSSTGDPDYRAALQYLYALSGVPRGAGAIRADHPRKLRRMQRLLALWGDPQRAFSTVLVAGTKGKGSTAAILAGLLRAGGYRVGRYTQPHLVSYRERTWVDGAFIAPHEVVALVAELRHLVDEAQHRSPDLGRYTTFEAGTALALAHFARAAVDIAVVEVGVGGARDATNVLDPLVSVVTPVSADHLGTIGPTLADVAREKAGILRPRHPAVLAQQVPEVEQVLEAAAAALASRPIWLGRDWRWEPIAGPPASGTFAVAGPGIRYDDLRLPLLGQHQRANAATAVAAAYILGEHEFRVLPDAVAHGLAAVSWPGRIQLISGSPPVVVDGAHNAASAATLRATIAECFPGLEVVLVLACTADKDIPALAAQLAPLATTVVATRTQHPRAASAESVATAVRATGRQALVANDVPTALRHALPGCPSGGLVVIAGSLFLAGEALEWLGGSMAAARSERTPRD